MYPPGLVAMDTHSQNSESLYLEYSESNMILSWLIYFPFYSYNDVYMF